MKYLSLCSGIEAFSVAVEGMGWEPMAFCEIEKFPSAVLAHRFPDVPNLGDITAVDWEAWREENGSPDVVVGGLPCQAFSVAGLRKGTEDHRGNLTIAAIDIIRAVKPRYFIFENVPGILSDSTNAFGCLLAGLLGHSEPVLPRDGKFASSGAGVGSGGKLAWRVLDAQYFGVAQRRKRVFLIFCPTDEHGNCGDPAQVLMERKEVRGSDETRQETREATSTETLTSSEVSGSQPLVCAPNFSKRENQQLPTSGGGQSYALTTSGVQAVCYNEPRRGEFSQTQTLTTGGRQQIEPVVVQGRVARCGLSARQNGKGFQEDGVGYTLDTIDVQGVQSGLIVRDLTEIETERLQDFPDNWTRIPYNGKTADNCPKGPRYKATGNSMAVPVMRWIAERIEINSCISL